MNAVDHAPQVHIHDRLPIGQFQIAQLAGQSNARIVEDQVEPPELLHRRLDGPLDIVEA